MCGQIFEQRDCLVATFRHGVHQTAELAKLCGVQEFEQHVVNLCLGWRKAAEQVGALLGDAEANATGRPRRVLAGETLGPQGGRKKEIETIFFVLDGFLRS